MTPEFWSVTTGRRELSLTEMVKNRFEASLRIQFSIQMSFLVLSIWSFGQRLGPEI